MARWVWVGVFDVWGVHRAGHRKGGCCVRLDVERRQHGAVWWRSVTAAHPSLLTGTLLV